MINSEKYRHYYLVFQNYFGMKGLSRRMFSISFTTFLEINEVVKEYFESTQNIGTDFVFFALLFCLSNQALASVCDSK